MSKQIAVLSMRPQPLVTLVSLLLAAPVSIFLPTPHPSHLTPAALAQTPFTPADELERAMNEGVRLFREGSKTSLTKAIEQFERALQLSQTADKQAQRALALLALGRIYDDLGEKPQALEYYKQALPLWRAVGDRAGEAATLNNIGGVYDALGEKPQALEYYKQALPLRRAVGDRAGEATTLKNIGLVYNDLGEQQFQIQILTREALTLED